MSFTIPTIFTAIDKFSQPLKRMSDNAESAAARVERSFRRVSEKTFDVSRRAFVTGAMIAAPLVLMGNEAVKFEDKLADIEKTTGIHGKSLRGFGDDILDMSTKTRSSIEELATIAEVGGRLGIDPSKLKAFTEEANKFAVALGGDFSGGVESAITQFGKVRSLFKDTRDLDVSDALRNAGSAFNALSAKGVNVEGLTDFSLRVGALPDVLKPSLAATAALGATFQKAGVDSQIASSGFSNFVTTAGENLPAFAKQMGLTTKQAQQLYNTDTAKFFVDFAASVKGVPADQLALKFKALKLNSLEVQKAVGAMSASQGTYTELFKMSSKEIANGTSILNEYNTKNNTTAGLFKQAKNQLQSLSITIGAQLIPIFNSLLSVISPIIKGITDWAKRNPGLAKTIGVIAVSLAGLSFAVSGVSFVIGSLAKLVTFGAQAFGVFSSAVKFAGTAIIWLSNALNVNPYVILIGAVAALGVAIWGLSKAFSGATREQEIYNEIAQATMDKAAGQLAEVTLLFNSLRKLTVGTAEHNAVLEKLEAIQPGITKQLQDKKFAVEALNQAEKELTKSIIERARQEAIAEKLKSLVTQKINAQQMQGADWIADINKSIFGTTFGGSKMDVMSQLDRDINITAEMAENKKPVDPEAAKQATASEQLKNSLSAFKFEFTGLPEGMGIKQSESTGSIAPVTTSTRK